MFIESSKQQQRDDGIQKEKRLLKMKKKPKTV